MAEYHRPTRPGVWQRRRTFLVTCAVWVALTVALVAGAVVGIVKLALWAVSW